MKTIEVGCLSEFIAKAKEHTNRDSHMPAMYRGQKDATWELETTLERFHPGPYSIEKYCEQLGRITSKFNIFSDKNYDADAFSTTTIDALRSNKPLREFMIHLRHLKFPSPLLDWSMSPYVAAHNAFSDVENQKPEKEKDERRTAIFVRSMVSATPIPPVSAA